MVPMIPGMERLDISDTTPLVKLQPTTAQSGLKAENLLIDFTNDLISAINHPEAGLSQAPRRIAAGLDRLGGKQDRARACANMRYCPP